MTHPLVGAGLPMYLPNGATIRSTVFKNLTSKDIFDPLKEMPKNIDERDIIV